MATEWSIIKRSVAEMDFFAPRSTPFLISLGVVVILATATFVASQPRRWRVIAQLRHRDRSTGSSTPPRSLSPEKRSSTEKLPASSNKPDLLTNLPPSRHQTLSSLSIKPSVGIERTPEAVRAAFVSTQKPYEDLPGKTRFTATGFTTEEIQALGDFPAYDILSGVPLPEPHENFNADSALPRPYRPLRWEYHQTMSFKKMEPNWWLEVENTYRQRIAERCALYEKHGRLVLDHLPGSELACKELMEMCLQYYCARYPKLFSLSTDNKTFHNELLGTNFDLNTMHPLLVILNNVPEDFAMVFRNEDDGLYYFRAGVICSALGWNVNTKMGLSLAGIHAPIPDYKEKMSMSMDRFFSKMPTDAPIQRGSWGLEVETPLFMPPGDPHEKLREYQKEDLKIEDCNLRVDWQTLRRLPLSGAVVFNFKALFTPVTAFRHEPYIPALLLKILKDGKESLMKYKSTWHVEHVVIPELEKYAAEQVANGMVKEGDGWKEGTLEEYPYFPGWEESWHRQQGF